MNRSDFHFDLPPELIAQYPLAERSASRLLALADDGAPPRDLRFTDLPRLLRPGDLLVFNNTRVMRARLFGHKDSGGAVEVLIERLLDPCEAEAQVRASKSPKPGRLILLGDGARLEVLGRDGDLFLAAGRGLQPRPKRFLRRLLTHDPAAASNDSGRGRCPVRRGVVCAVASRLKPLPPGSGQPCT